MNKGFQNTTMEDVNIEIGMSRGGVYNHYSSTTEMLRDLMLDGNDYRNSLIDEYLEKNKGKDKYQQMGDILMDKTLADFDGPFTYGELKSNTDPNNRDTDGDGVIDGVEIAMGFDPLLSLDYPIDFNMPDTDGEGLFDKAEGMFGTDINNPDTDGDGYSDYWEVMHGTDPLDSNSPGNFPDKIVRPNSRLEAIKALINSTAASDTLDSVAISEYQITTTEE